MANLLVKEECSESGSGSSGFRPCLSWAGSTGNKGYLGEIRLGARRAGPFLQGLGDAVIELRKRFAGRYVPPGGFSDHILENLLRQHIQRDTVRSASQRSRRHDLPAYQTAGFPLQRD